jgi:hypothetical protein
MTKPNRAADFLRNMSEDLTPPVTPPVSSPPAASHAPPRREAKHQPAPGRTGLKHIGGYFDLDTVEKVAVLRARLRLDNSELIKLAIDELHRKYMAKRAFGDA